MVRLCVKTVAQSSPYVPMPGTLDASLATMLRTRTGTASQPRPWTFEPPSRRITGQPAEPAQAHQPAALDPRAPARAARHLAAPARRARRLAAPARHAARSGGPQPTPAQHQPVCASRLWRPAQRATRLVFTRTQHPIKQPYFDGFPVISTTKPHDSDDETTRF